MERLLLSKPSGTEVSFLSNKGRACLTATRYWSHAALGCLHRLIAVEEWLTIKSGEESANSFEKPLAALDLFILEERAEGDPDDVSTGSGILLLC